MSAERIIKEKKQPFILTPEHKNITTEIIRVIINDGIVVMKIDGPMYGLVANVADPAIVSRMWRIKGRKWLERPIRMDEEAVKPVTAVSAKRFYEFVDWQGLNWDKNDKETHFFLQSKLHLIFPVNEDIVPSHLVTLHGKYGEIPTLSMMVVDESFPVLGQVVCQLEKTHPEIIVGGSSANKTGSPVITELQPLIQSLGEEVELIVQGESEIYDLTGNRLAYQRGMVLVLPDKIKIIREGIGINQFEQQLSHFSEPFAI